METSNDDTPPAYGSKGCQCWLNDDYDFWDDRTERWLPNASCRYHGVLAPYTPPRLETGQYRIVGLPEPQPLADLPRGISTPPDGLPREPVLPELAEKDAEADIWGGVLSPVEEYDNPPECTSADCCQPMDCPGPAADGACLNPTTNKKESGVLAAILRWSRGGYRVFTRSRD